MSHKYLKGLNGWVPHFCRARGNPFRVIKREIKWFFERRKYGFDSRETWNMDQSFYCWAYERISLYVKVTEVDIDSDFNCITINGETACMRKWINKILALLKEQIEDDDPLSIAYSTCHQEIMTIFTELLPYLWW